MRLKCTQLFFFFLYILLFCLFPSDLRGFLLAAAERESPAAGLQPRLPQNLLPRQLVFRTYRLPLVSLRSAGAPLQDLGVVRLSVGTQRAGLRGVVQKVVDQRRLVLRHVSPGAHADPGVVASA